MDFLISLIAFLFALTILISFHEFGHFWVARMLGVKVLKFSLGFGKALASRKDKKGTEYVVSIIPLGGYVKMLDEQHGEVSEKDLPYAFNRQPILNRIAIVIAGPMFNLLFAVIAFWLMFSIGMQSVAPIVGEVLPNSPAAEAEIHVGEEFIALNGRTTDNWISVRKELLRHSDDESSLSIQLREQKQ